MENSCRKKHKPSPKKWILASRYSEFRRNPALIPANAGLFHYAANNPVRYIDPTGMYEQDHENKVYSFDILNKMDFDNVASLMMDKQREGYVARGYDNNTGNYIEFNSYTGMLKFSETTQDPSSVRQLLGTVDTIINTVSDFVTGDYVARLSQIEKYSAFKRMKQLDKTSSVLGKCLLAESLVKAGYCYAFEDDKMGAVNNLVDAGICAIGIWGGPGGAVTSIYLGKAKTGLLFASEQFALFEKFLEQKTVNGFSQYYFGINIIPKW